MNTDTQNFLELLQAVRRLAGVVDRVVDTIQERENFMLWNFLSLEADHFQAKNAAKIWIAEHLFSSRKRRDIRELKHVCEHACERASQRGFHLKHADFRQLLIDSERFKIKNGFVWCSVLE